MIDRRKQHRRQLRYRGHRTGKRLTRGGALGAATIQGEGVTLRRDHAVAVPRREQRDATTTVPIAAAHVDDEQIRRRVGHPRGRDHERHDTCAGRKVLVAAQHEIGAVRLRLGARLQDVAAAARFRDHRAPPMPLLGGFDEASALRAPRLDVGLRISRREPERQHRRMHRRDERDAGIAFGQYPHQFGVVAHRIGKTSPQAALLQRHTGQ